MPKQHEQRRQADSKKCPTYLCWLRTHCIFDRFQATFGGLLIYALSKPEQTGSTNTAAFESIFKEAHHLEGSFAQNWESKGVFTVRVGFLIRNYIIVALAKVIILFNR